MKTFEMNAKKANVLVNNVWNSYMNEDMHDNTLSSWVDEKRRYLAGMFGEELILEKEVEVEQTYETLRDELNTFHWKLVRAVQAESWFEEARKKDGSMQFYIRHVLSTRNLYKNKCDGKYDLGGKRKFNVGDKISRALKKLITDPTVLNNLQVEYSQIVNTKKLKGKLCLSIHPLDFLTMSHTSTWGSCYDVFNEGEYRAGALEFMCSDNTICAYLYTKDMKISGQEVWNDKKWRCIVSVNPEEYIMTGKNYPYYSDELTSLTYEWVKELTSKASEFPSFESTKHLSDISFEIDVEYGYNDADCGSSDCFRVGLNENKDNENYLYVGYGTVPCTKCGRTNDIEAEDVVCLECDDSFCCDHCGDRSHGDSYEVHDRWGGVQWICYYCLDDSYRYCESCGEYHYYDCVTEINNDIYCEDCRDEKFTYCEKCDEYYENDKVREHSGRMYCEDCYNEIIEEERENEEEEA